MTAKEAEIAGLVARVVPNDKVLTIFFSVLITKRISMHTFNILKLHKWRVKYRHTTWFR